MPPDAGAPLAAPIPTTEGKLFDPRSGEWVDAHAKGPDPEAPRRDFTAKVWHAILALDLAVSVVVFTGAAWLPAAPEPAPTTQADLYVGAFLLAFLLGFVPLMWAIFTRQGGAHGAWHYLRLERPLKGIAIGVGVGALILVGVMVLGLVLERTDIPTENPRLEAMGSIMTVPLAFTIAAAAAFGEEILFRGVLQRWIGVWGQAAVFGLAHASWGTPLQVILPFVIGLGFGFLVKRGFRLWVPIAAHFTFDFVVLVAAIALRDAPV